jgi:hypothetical protein
VNLKRKEKRQNLPMVVVGEIDINTPALIFDSYSLTESFIIINILFLREKSFDY